MKALHDFGAYVGPYFVILYTRKQGIRTEFKIVTYKTLHGQ